MTATTSQRRAADAGRAQPAPPPPSWGIHLQPAGGLLVERRSLYYVRLSGTAVELALQLARTGSIERTARVRAATDRRRPEDVRAELVAGLGGSPVTASWLDGALGGGVRVSGSTEAYLPLMAILQLTNRCNLSCSFCYASSGAAMPDELTADDWVRVLERLARAGTATVTLTGGEPTIARDFRRILATASALIDSVDVFTNGLHWSDDLIAMAAACGNVQAQVSIDGLAARHDLVRGRPGAYAESLDTIRRLSGAGVPVFVAMTLTPANVGDLAAVVTEVAAAGARLFRASRVVTVGRGDRTGFALTEEQTAAVLRQFRQVRGLDIRVLAWDQCSDIGQELAGAGLPVEFLTPGYLSWYVRADGEVTPCQIEEQSFGQITAAPLEHLGRPDRLADVRARARGCRCIRRLNPDTEVDLPFGLAPADARAGGACACATSGGGGRCGG
ncbi:MAG TPA: sporulation killing factor system radical SAM maturase [Pilimelia sp.]|nr:sporulation killing factor system radical SAM maturase [Pilimelia sp.]